MRDTTKRLAEEMRSRFGTLVRDHGERFVNGGHPARPAPGTNVSRDCRSDSLGSLPYWLTEQGFTDWWYANVGPEPGEAGRPLRDLGMTTVEAVRWEIAREQNARRT